MLGKKHHIIRYIPSIFRPWMVCMFLLFSLTPTARCQEGLTITAHSGNRIVIEYSLQNIHTSPAEDGYAMLSSPAANSYSHQPGLPMLPLTRQLAALNGDKFEINIQQQKWDTINLLSIGCHYPLMPFLGAKAKESELLAFNLDSVYYAADSMMETALINISPLGLMRGSPLAELTIAPIRYNPAQGTIAICRKLKASISSNGLPATDDCNSNPMLHKMGIATPLSPKDYANIIAQDTIPQVYVVASASRYRQTLQPLISWKRQEGYLVDELYFDLNNSQTVKDSLQQRYDNASPEHPAPLFVLIVGDMDAINLWGARNNIEGLEPHRTDFYYSEFTGDMLPDAMIGRLSVHDTAELRHIIEKTIAYEKGFLPDTLALRRSLLVAGREETIPAPTVTNGQVNYIKQLLMAHDPEHDTICLYNPESGDSRDVILATLREGVSLINYTAHCNTKGWRDPKLNNNDINNSDVVDNHIFVAINNCCRSNDVAGECFGEMLLRKAEGGAVGAIGASNETLWEEDYYWSVGFGNVTSTPEPDSCGAGAFDRLLHPNLQNVNDQAWTMGQMLTAGNMAVTASGSPFADFYWEIYLLLGDPSLMPHIGPLRPIILECDSVMLGDNTLALHGTPWAKVAAVCGDTLMGICTLDANGDATMHFRQPVASNICITATRQFYKTKQITFHLVDTNNVDINSQPSTLNSQLVLYPNPANNNITIKGLSQPSKLTVLDIMGRIIMEKEVIDGETISLNQHLPKGVYTFSITTPHGTIEHKRIVISSM